MRPRIESLEPRRLLSAEWETADDYQYVPESENAATALTVDSAGRVYAAGAVEWWPEAREVVRTSLDGGATWSVLSDRPSPGSRITYINDIEVGADGDIFLAGSYLPVGTGDAGPYWFVRRSTDGGRTWETVDTPAPDGVLRNEAMDLAVDAAGAVYAVGKQLSEPWTAQWLVRRSTDGGDTWATVDSVASASPAGVGAALGVFAHPTAGVFVAGGTDGGSPDDLKSRWVVRRSTDGGDTWAGVDEYLPDPEYGAEAVSLGADAAGNLYAVGQANHTGLTGPVLHWVVRRSADGGDTWTTVDDFTRFTHGSQATGFATDVAGNLYVAGMGLALEGGTTHTHWVVRRDEGGTGAWSTVDDFQLTPGANARPYAIAAVPSGGVFVAGTAETADLGWNRWIVRRCAGAPAAAVAGRHVFYNRSFFDGNDLAANALDDAAVATDKVALRPGQSATFSNVTSYARGINGVMVDIANLSAGSVVTADDFDFGPAPRPSSVAVRRGAGVGGSDRVTLVWADGAVRNAWLAVTVRANANTGLPAPDVFWFGNLAGDTGGPGTPRVDVIDLARTRANLGRTTAAARAASDFNRDGRVNAVDLGTVRSNQRRSLPLFVAPTGAGGAPRPAGFSDAPVPIPIAPIRPLTAPPARRSILGVPDAGLVA